MEKFINVTPKALEYIKSSVKNQGCIGVRVDIKSGGCRGLTYELEFVNEENPADLTIEEEDVKIYVSSKAAIFVENMTMDYVSSAMGGNIVFENPNAKSNCSCGKSFCVDENESACSGSCH